MYQNYAPNYGAHTYRAPITSNSKAKWFIIAPRQIPDTIIRPHQYSFNGQFMSDLKGIIEQSTRPGNISNIHNLAWMNNSAAALNAITPTTVGMQAATNVLSQAYTFMLVIDNDNVDSFGNRISSDMLMDTRYVYTGYFIDEPVNPLTNTWNLEASVIITHTTTLTANVSMHGRYQTNYSVAQDMDIVYPTVTSSLLNNDRYGQLFANTSENTMRCSVIQNDESGNPHVAVSADTASMLLPPNDGVAGKLIMSSENSARSHAHGIVSAMCRTACDLVQTSSYMNGSPAQLHSFGGQYDYLDEGMPMMETVLVNQLSNHGLANNVPAIGISPNKIYKVEHILGRYPGTEMHLIQGETMMASDLSIGSENTINHVLNNFIRDTLITLMYNYNVSIFIFSYDSYTPGELIPRNNEYGWPGKMAIHDIRTFVVDEGNDVIINRFLIEFGNLIVKPLLQHGHFRLNSTASVAGGDVYVNYSNIEHFGYTNETIMAPTAMGGNISPIVAHHNVFSGNVSEAAAAKLLLKDVTDTINAGGMRSEYMTPTPIFNGYGEVY